MWDDVDRDGDKQGKSESIFYVEILFLQIYCIEKMRESRESNLNSSLYFELWDFFILFFIFFADTG